MNDRVSTNQGVQAPSIAWRIDCTLQSTRYSFPSSSYIFGKRTVSVFRSVFMGTPFGGVGCVRTPLSACRGTHPFAARRAQRRCPGLTDVQLQLTFDACHAARSVAVGGFFVSHGGSLAAGRAFDYS